MEVTRFLTGHLLIAMPHLADLNFSRTVALICEHSEEGAMGLIINRRLGTVRLADVFDQLGIDDAPLSMTCQPVYQGGPVQLERGFVLHQPEGDWQAAVSLDCGIGLATSRDILIALGKGRGPRQAMVAFGYSGWGPGQLERELAESAWLSAPLDPRLLFSVPIAQRWRAAAASIGVDLSLVAACVGHA